jgi:hypothetical protein
METQIEEPKTIEQTERLLIWADTVNIAITLQEVEGRAAMLNSIIKHGLSMEEVNKITSSSTAIEDYIFREQLKVNKELKKQFDAGKKNIRDEYELPSNLASLKYALLAWFNYKMPMRTDSKIRDLVFANNQWEINHSLIEKQLVANRQKIYISGETMQEYKSILQLCDYFNRCKVESNNIFASQFLKIRITNANRKYEPNPQYFRRDDDYSQRQYQLSLKENTYE